MSNYIPNKTKAFGDQNLPWVNVEIENLINAKNEVFKKYSKNNQSHHYTYKYKGLQGKLESLIEFWNIDIIEGCLKSYLQSVLVLNATGPY